MTNQWIEILYQCLDKLCYMDLQKSGLPLNSNNRAIFPPSSTSRLPSALLDFDLCKFYCRVKPVPNSNYKYIESSKDVHENAVCNEYSYSRDQDGGITVVHREAGKIPLAECSLQSGQRNVFDTIPKDYALNLPRVMSKDRIMGMQWIELWFTFLIDLKRNMA